MREYAAIQRELAHYVDQYKRYDAEQTAYDDVKRRAKGLFEAILTEKQATESELSSHGAAWDDWHEADKQLKIKAASYRLLQETEKVEAYEGNFREKNAAFAAVQERVAADEKFYYSLRHAQLVAELNEYKQLY